LLINRSVLKFQRWLELKTWGGRSFRMPPRMKGSQDEQRL
jgi:hypothetical protein